MSKEAPHEISFPIRISKALKSAIDHACEKTGWSQQVLCRTVIALGLEDLKRCNYDIISPIVDASQKILAAEKIHVEKKKVSYFPARNTDALKIADAKGQSHKPKA